MRILIFIQILLQGSAILFQDAVKKRKEKCGLKEIGTTYQVDKVDGSHRYDGLYCTLLQPYRQIQLNMLEIGFGCGHHVQGRGGVMWKKYFAAADYYAIDFLPPGRNMTAEKCMTGFKQEFPLIDIKKVWFGDQSDSIFLKQVTTEYTKTSPTWDVIIDDGGHYYNQIVASLVHLWPLVSPGGLYIIEDLNMDPGFSKVMGTWTTLIAARNREKIVKDPTGDAGLGTVMEASTSLLKKDAPKKENTIKLEDNIPKDVSEMGCSYQICYFRKALNPSEIGNKK
jgi:hypothetical protein